MSRSMKRMLVVVLVVVSVLTTVWLIVAGSFVLRGDRVPNSSRVLPSSLPATYRNVGKGCGNGDGGCWMNVAATPEGSLLHR
jgi:hypothetical protein